jgi:hypothetical protein
MAFPEDKVRTDFNNIIEELKNRDFNIKSIRTFYLRQQAHE